MLKFSILQAWKHLKKKDWNYIMNPQFISLLTGEPWQRGGGHNHSQGHRRSHRLYEYQPQDQNREEVDRPQRPATKSEQTTRNSGLEPKRWRLRPSIRGIEILETQTKMICWNLDFPFDPGRNCQIVFYVRVKQISHELYYNYKMLHCYLSYYPAF